MCAGGWATSLMLNNRGAALDGHLLIVCRARGKRLQGAHDRQRSTSQTPVNPWTVRYGWGGRRRIALLPSRSPLSNVSFSTRAPGRRNRKQEARSSIGLRPHTTGGADIVPSECWLRWSMSSNTRYSATQPNEAVYQIGASPNHCNAGECGQFLGLARKEMVVKTAVAE